ASRPGALVDSGRRVAGCGAGGQLRVGHPLTSTADMDVRDFDFDLPPELIAQEPPAGRGGARLLYLGPGNRVIAPSRVSALPDLLQSGDLVVVNNTRVFPARLLGRRVPTGGAVECLLIQHVEGSDLGQTQVRPRSDRGLTQVRPTSEPTSNFPKEKRDW